MAKKRTIEEWVIIQKHYDSGMSFDDLYREFHVSSASLHRAKKEGLFKSRSMSQATKLYRKNNPDKIKLSDETKKKISERRKKFLRENPDKIPYKLNHYSKGDSYPEKYFKEVFEKENIPLKFHLPVGLYELDFYNEEYKIDVEIDGEQHYADKRIVESDVRRTNFLTSQGWRVYRIRWAEYQKLSHEDKCKVVDEVRKLMGPKL